MTVLAIAGSPRRGGTSDTLLGRVVAGLEQGGARVTTLYVADMRIDPCTGCGACLDVPACGIRDDFSALVPRLIACDALVFASPLYFMNVPAAGKAFIDRCQLFWNAKHHRGEDLFGGRARRGLLVACAGARRGPGGADVFRGLLDTMTYVFDALGMAMQDGLCVGGVESPQDLVAREGVLDDAFDRGHRLARDMTGGA